MFVKMPVRSFQMDLDIAMPFYLLHEQACMREIGPLIVIAIAGMQNSERFALTVFQILFMEVLMLPDEVQEIFVHEKKKIKV
jgi:hypothetical protein